MMKCRQDEGFSTKSTNHNKKISIFFPSLATLACSLCFIVNDCDLCLDLSRVGVCEESREDKAICRRPKKYILKYSH